jgi:protein-S-isoprenylcysteine O-methyltransferase Ste14
VQGIEEREKMKQVFPPTYFLGAIILAVLLHFLLPLHQFLGFPWRLLGLVPVLSGIVLNVLADRAFKRRNTTVKPFEKSRALITDGVFGLTRNPMYLGMAMILLGIAILLGSVTPFLVVSALAAVFECFFIRPEEQMLEERFGARFRQYRGRVRRWI